MKVNATLLSSEKTPDGCQKRVDCEFLGLINERDERSTDDYMMCVVRTESGGLVLQVVHPSRVTLIHGDCY